MTEPRRFYLFSEGLHTNPSDFDLENRDELYATLGPDVRPEYFVDGYNHPIKFGLHSFTRTPKLKVAIKNKPLDLYGMGPWYVSTAAKELLSDIDPHAFEFLRCETRAPARHEVNDYWMMEVKRVVEAFDEKNAVFVRRDAVELTTGETSFNPFISILYELKLPKLASDLHAFYLNSYLSTPIFDGVLIDAIRNAGLRGFRFTPLQRPRQDEISDLVNNVTFPYWYDKVKADA